MDQSSGPARLRVRQAASSQIETVEAALFDTLSVDTERRIRRIAAVLSEVLARPLDDWLDDFARDTHARREIALWERVVSFFLHFARHSDPLPRKREVLHVLLDCAEESPVFASLTAHYRHLDPGEMVDIRRKWFGCN